MCVAGGRLLDDAKGNGYAPTTSLFICSSGLAYDYTVWLLSQVFDFHRSLF